MSPDEIKELARALRPKQRPERQVPSWAPLAVTLVSLIVGATAYLAPQSDRIDRVEQMVITERTANREIHLTLDRQIGDVSAQMQRSEEESRAVLAQIQADVSVIKARLDQNP